MAKSRGWWMAGVLIVLASGCGDDATSGAGGGGGAGGTGGTGGSNTTTGGNAKEGDPCRAEGECESPMGFLSCFLPGECNSGVGPCPGPSHCLAGETASFDGCEATPCDLTAPDCPLGSTCTDEDCNNSPCTLCIADTPTCVADADCPAGYACIVSECREGCRVNTDCGSANEHCDDAHECTPKPCAMDGECADGYCLEGGCYDTLGTCEGPAA